MAKKKAVESKASRPKSKVSKKKASPSRAKKAARKPKPSAAQKTKKAAKKTTKAVRKHPKPAAKKADAKKTKPKAAPKKPSKQPKPKRVPHVRVRSGLDASLRAAQEGVALPKITKRRTTRLPKNSLDMFRQMLLEKRDELVGDVQNLTNEALHKSRQEASGDLSAMPIHMADIGTDNWEQEFTLGLIENEKALVREIDEALARISDRTYGICLATNQPITKTRLKAKPWAKYCIEYARMREMGRLPANHAEDE